MESFHTETQNQGFLCVLQLFEDRVKLVIRWFDLWTDRQRKHLMSSLLGRCTSSQLRWAICPPLLTQKLIYVCLTLNLNSPGAAGIC